jgi:hypothetical protein
MEATKSAQIDAMVMVKRDYGNHPCGTRFCKCGWIKIPPSYPTDFWDCTNPECEISTPPTKADLKKMEKGSAHSNH